MTEQRKFICQVSICDEPAAAMRLSPQASARLPDAWKLCADHLSIKLGGKGARPKVEKVHPAYDMFKRKPPVCYGLAGECPNKGALYPGGVYCEDHSPKRAKLQDNN